ncbi:helix-turn-helix domain-containing protein, partial [Escherichia coli]|nr:helix-turn-helix domain-containing protein [Escherichia coli]HCS1814072.1 helix-turn-helix domain-containing protein [Shigella flexneri]
RQKAASSLTLQQCLKFGRRRTVDRNVVLTLHQKGTGATEIAHQLSIARSTVYKILEDERAS